MKEFILKFNEFTESDYCNPIKCCAPFVIVGYILEFIFRSTQSFAISLFLFAYLSIANIATIVVTIKSFRKFCR